MHHQLRVVIAGLILLASRRVAGQVPPAAFVNFEARQTAPIRLSPDRKQLFAVNTADARLSVFDIRQTPPLLVKEIPVGIEPVSANARTNDEVWVVNELSDSVSVVSVSAGLVTDTINVKDEPADVVFAGGLAFVSVSGTNEVRVYDVVTHALRKTISLAGERPRAMAVNAARTKVFVVFAESGNRTTLIPRTVAPPQPPPTNQSLPPPPRVGLIVDANDPAWKPSFIEFTMPDNDVAEIDVATLSVSRYFSRVGTSNLGIAVQPNTGDLFVVNTDSRNLVRFEPNLRGHVVDNRVTRIPSAGGSFTISDLNRDTDYRLLPNAAARANALAQPSSIAFDPTGSFSYIAAFGSDRIAKVSADGTILARIGLRSDASNSSQMRGPRGLALNAATGRLYVLNRISNSLSVIDTVANSVIAEMPIGAFDPTPWSIRNGRGFLYDARLSGNGTVSCASCHLDGNTDRLAWDLGDRGGEMRTVTAVQSRSGGMQEFHLHPMKGPMATQSLKGLQGIAPLHWRGDRADLAAFNPAFESLLGGSQLPAQQMNAFAAFIRTMRLPPNPNQQLDRTFPPTFASGDPSAGQSTFLHDEFTSGNRCADCHKVSSGIGTDNSMSSKADLQESQPFKVPHLRGLYQKTFFDNSPGAQSRDGFGLSHDGAHAGFLPFLSRAVFGVFRTDVKRKADITAFLMCLDTGIAPAVGFTRTMSLAHRDDATASTWALLESQAATGNIDLMAKGTIDGQLHGLVYEPFTGGYRSDQAGVGPFTRAQLQMKIAAGDTLSIIGVPPGSGTRMGIDRDLDGVADGDEPTNANRGIAR